VLVAANQPDLTGHWVGLAVRAIFAAAYAQNPLPCGSVLTLRSGRTRDCIVPETHHWIAVRYRLESIRSTKFS